MTPPTLHTTDEVYDEEIIVTSPRPAIKVSSSDPAYIPFNDVDGEENPQAVDISLIEPLDDEGPVVGEPDDATPRVYVAPRTLRPYQYEAVAAVRDSWRKGIYRPIISLPTGTGKSTVIAQIACLARQEGKRVLLLAHRVELLKQMAESVQSVQPRGDMVGIVSGTYRQPNHEIVAASFGSLRSEKTRALLGKRDVILVDEVHHSTAETYRETLEEYGVAQGGETLAAGFSATARREQGSALATIWDEVVYERDIAWAVEQGYLIPPTGLTVELAELDGLAKIKSNHGDYATAELDDMMHQATGAVVDAIKEHAPTRKMIVFATNRENAMELAVQMEVAGFRVRTLFGSHGEKYRMETYEMYHKDELDALVTVQVLTEGADFPSCDCVVMARPTRSITLYIQMVGRALRLYTHPITGEVKKDAIVLDLVGCSRDKSLVSESDIYGDSNEDAEPEEKEEKEDEDLDDLDDDIPISRTQKVAHDERIILTTTDLIKRNILTSPYPAHIFLGAHNVMWIQKDSDTIITPIRGAGKGFYALQATGKIQGDERLFTLTKVPGYREENGALAMHLTRDAVGKLIPTVKTFPEWMLEASKEIPAKERSKYTPSEFTTAATLKQREVAARFNIRPLDHTRGGHFVSLSKQFFVWAFEAASRRK